MEQSKNSILQTSLHNFGSAAKRLKLDEAMRERVLTTYGVMTLWLNGWKMAEGQGC